MAAFYRKDPLEEFKTSSLSRKYKGLYSDGYVSGIQCSISADTRENVTLLRADLAKNLKKISSIQLLFL